MSTMSPVIEHTAQARVIARPTAFPVRATLRYDSADPLAVHVVFPGEAALDGAEVTWTFARELLQQALRGPAGGGDVLLWQGGSGQTVLELRAPEGVALAELRTQDVRRFLRRSYAVVPPGEEPRALHLDRDLAELLGGV